MLQVLIGGLCCGWANESRHAQLQNDNHRVLFYSLASSDLSSFVNLATVCKKKKVKIGNIQSKITLN